MQSGSAEPPRAQGAVRVRSSRGGSTASVEPRAACPGAQRFPAAAPPLAVPEQRGEATTRQEEEDDAEEERAGQDPYPENCQERFPEHEPPEKEDEETEGDTQITERCQKKAKKQKAMPEAGDPEEEQITERCPIWLVIMKGVLSVFSYLSPKVDNYAQTFHCVLYSFPQSPTARFCSEALIGH